MTTYNALKIIRHIVNAIPHPNNIVNKILAILVKYNINEN